MDVTVNEVRAQKRELEEKITELLKNFTSETGLEVHFVSLDSVRLVGERLPAYYIVEAEVRI